MSRLEQRLSKLEAAQAIRTTELGLVLLAPDGRLSATDQARADAERAAGREVLVIDLVGMARDGND